jgi:uncharacterized protein with PIN domain
MQKIIPVQFRFFGDLKIFLLKDRRGKTFVYHVRGNPSIKDSVEALGVPHTEVKAILVNGKKVNFSYQLRENDRVKVYPYLYQGKIIEGKTAPRKLSFVIDSHLGKLARHLRLMGFDSIFFRTFPDELIIKIAKEQNRIVLTRDIGILKNKSVKHGYWVRNIEPAAQLRETFKRYDMFGKERPFTLCLECNGRIKKINLKSIKEDLPPLVRKYNTEFFTCTNCRKIYWKGSHYKKLSNLIKSIKRKN